MRSRRSPPLLRLAFGVLLLGPSPALFAGTPPSPSGAAAESAAEALVCTIRSFDPEAGTLDLLTGCGHALRVVRVSVLSETKITRKGTAAGLPDLRPGTIVRVEFRREGDRNVARTIKVEGSGGGR